MREAAAWEQLLASAGLQDLERWCRSKEQDWGRAHVFVEAVVPRGKRPVSKKNQIDLLVCFDDRVACCEMKQQFRVSRDWVERSWSQIREQHLWMEQLFTEEGYDERGLRMFLFCPNLDTVGLGAVRRHLRDRHSAPHVWAAGADLELRGMVDDERRPYYLIEALEENLGANFTRLRPGQQSIPNFLLRLMERAQSRLLEFTSFDGLLRYLRNVVPAKRSFIWDSGYVPEVFSLDVIEAVRLLKVGGAVEITGPPGCGKSTVVKETIEALDEEWVELRFRDNTLRADITARVYEAVHGVPPPLNAAEDTLIQDLASETRIIWFQGYDHNSAAAVEDFVTAFRLIKNANAYLIVESAHGLTTLDAGRHHLAPLANQTIYQIVDRTPPGGFFTDPEQVVDLAQGNVRRAIVLWRSKTEREAISSSSIEWFLHRLSTDEKAMLAVVCHAVRNSAFGVTSGLLRAWGSVAFPATVPAERERVLNGLLEKLEVEQLAHVFRLTSKTFDDHLEGFLPARCELISIDYLAAEVLAAFPVSEIDQRIDQDRLQSALLEGGPEGSITFVVSGLLQGDLEPYFRSSFRTTSLPVVPEWCKRSGWDSANARQNYLLRAMRINAAVRPNTTLDAEQDCGLPDSGDALQKYAFAVLKARIKAYQPAASGDAVPQIPMEGDMELYAEQMVSLARRLQFSRRYSESWNVLNSLIRKTAKGTVGRFLANYRALEFLNRKKQREGILSERDAGELITAYATELIAYAVSVENVPAICDGLFYFVRSRELRQREFSPASVNAYSVALTLVEKSRRWRARRLQVLLTHGSLHRHAAMCASVGWEDFLQHHDAAFNWYRRALRSAAAQHNEQHVLNALAYMSGLVIKALRFAPSISGTGRELIISRSAEVLSLVRSNILEKAATSGLVLEDNAVRRTVCENVPYLLYVEAYGMPTLAEESAQRLRASWHQFSLDAETRLQSAEWQERAKRRSILGSNLKRLLKFGACFDSRKTLTIHSVIGESLARFSKIAPIGGRY